jgi:hypothetical protein
VKLALPKRTSVKFFVKFWQFVPSSRQIFFEFILVSPVSLDISKIVAPSVVFVTRTEPFTVNLLLPGGVPRPKASA